jgi:hypothetical protein
MALRLNEMVTHGVIDNREKGKVIGACWFIGRDSPIRFELIGNCGSDLAGCLVEFINRKPQSAGFLGELPDQVGEAGIITASRMVRAIPADIPLQNLTREALDRWGWIYSLYLEWFSRSNGRVVVEIVDPELRISEPPEKAEGGKESTVCSEPRWFQDPLIIRAKDLCAAVGETGNREGSNLASADNLENLYSALFQGIGKVADALHRLIEGDERREPAFLIALLKRSLGEYHSALGFLERIPNERVPADLRQKWRDEILGIRQEILNEMNGLRQRA